MKNQFTYLINNKTTQGMFILILFIPCIEIVQLYIMLKPDAVNIHPAFAFFLQVQAEVISLKYYYFGSYLF